MKEPAKRRQTRKKVHRGRAKAKKEAGEKKQGCCLCNVLSKFLKK